MAYSTAHPLRGLTVNIHSPEFVYGMRVDSPATMTKGERAKLLVQASAYTLAHDLRKGWRLRRAEAPTGPWAKNIQELRTDGVTVIPGFMSTSEVDALRAKVFEFVDRFKHTTRLANGTQVIFRDEEQHRGVDTGMIDVFNIDHSVPEVAKIRDHPSVHEIVRGGFARPTNLKFVTSYINRSVTNPRGYHADTLATTEFKAFLVLTDVNDREDGAHAYIPKTHRFSFQKYRNIWRNVMDKGYSISDTNLVDESKARVHIAPRGALVIEDMNGFHRGLPQSPGRSRALIVVDFGDARHTGAWKAYAGGAEVPRSVTSAAPERRESPTAQLS